MSRRLNLYGFSLSQMRRLCGSRDQDVILDLQQRIESRFGYRPMAERQQLSEIVTRAVMAGLPFPELQVETWHHAAVADLLAVHGQEWLITHASNYHASALEEGLWRQARKHASPEAIAFLRGLVEGIPIFGQQSPRDGFAYAAVPLEKLKAFQPHLRDLAESLAYRVGRKKVVAEEDTAGATFAGEFCTWVEQVASVGRDMWFTFG